MWAPHKFNDISVKNLRLCNELKTKSGHLLPGCFSFILQIQNCYSRTCYLYEHYLLFVLCYLHFDFIQVFNPLVQPVYWSLYCNAGVFCRLSHVGKPEKVGDKTN